MALLVLVTACAGGRQALPGTPRQLPADSLALLEAAMERARPAYPTQAEAIRAGAYAEGRLARERKRAEEAARVARIPAPGEPGVAAATPVPGSAAASGAQRAPVGSRATPTAAAQTRAEPLRKRTNTDGEPPLELAVAAPAPAGASGVGGAAEEVEASGVGEAAGEVEASGPAGSDVTAPQAAGGFFVIQIGAFPKPALALAAAENASLRFPGTEPVIEWAGGLYRAAIGEWRSRESAASRLATVREAYPDAWIRERPRP